MRGQNAAGNEGGASEGMGEIVCGRPTAEGKLSPLTRIGLRRAGRDTTLGEKVPEGGVVRRDGDDLLGAALER